MQIVMKYPNKNERDLSNELLTVLYILLDRFCAFSTEKLLTLQL